VECPYCGRDSRVTDSRKSGDGIRRRRECLACERRFTTYERLEQPEIRVVKRMGQPSQPFDREKLRRVVAKVVRNRPVSKKSADDLVRGLEAELLDSKVQSIESAALAERLLSRLAEVDPIAAARFASNYTHEDGVVRTSDKAASPQMRLPLLGSDAAPQAEPASDPGAPPRRRRR
jgi:transcriptional repressor NrdR